MIHKNILELENVSFVYDGDDIPVWQGLNCCFKEHTINLLLGPSGCGKSTMLYMLNGIIPNFYEGKATGHIWYEGQDILTKKPKDMVRDIGMVFQNPETQFCTFTVEDELAFGLENMNTPRAEIDKKIDDALDMVGMRELRTSLLSDLSGGQKQKIAIASILVMETRILALDEPTANLDAASRRDVFELLEKLVDEYEKTVILVEHNLEHLLKKVGHMIVFDENNTICMEGESGLVVRNLIYNQNYANLNIFLPEQYLIVKAVMQALSGYEAIHKFREEQLCRDASEEEIVPLEAFAKILERIGYTGEYLQTTHKKESNPLIIQAGQLSYCYQGSKDDIPTLRKVDMTIEKGDFVAIVGANGVGKSTLLKVLFKVLKPYEGSIHVEDKELQMWKKTELYHEFGLVFQNPESQFVTNIVSDELLFSLKKTDLSEEEKEKRVDTMLHKFHLEKEKEKSPFLLSQGQKRRLSVATMLLTGQKVLILDEPTYGQDYDNQRELMDLMRELNAEGVTIVIVTHDMSLVADYVNKVAVLADGTTEFYGTPEELFDNMEMIERGKLEVPAAFRFSQKLKKALPKMPLFISGQKMTEHLIHSVKEGA